MIITREEFIDKFIPTIIKDLPDEAESCEMITKFYELCVERLRHIKEAIDESNRVGNSPDL